MRMQCNASAYYICTAALLGIDPQFTVVKYVKDDVLLVLQHCAKGDGGVGVVLLLLLGGRDRRLLVPVLVDCNETTLGRLLMRVTLSASWWYTVLLRYILT